MESIEYGTYLQRAAAPKRDGEGDGVVDGLAIRNQGWMVNEMGLLVPDCSSPGRGGRGNALFYYYCWIG